MANIADHSMEDNGIESNTSSLLDRMLALFPDASREGVGYRATCPAHLAQRVSVLEAFVATLQRQAFPGAGAPRLPTGAPTVKRGFVIAQELSERIDAYAKRRGMRVMDVLDQALRDYFAAHDGAGEGR